MSGYQNIYVSSRVEKYIWAYLHHIIPLNFQHQSDFKRSSYERIKLHGMADKAVDL